MGVHLTDVQLIRVHVANVYLIGARVHLTDAYLIGLYLTGVHRGRCPTFLPPSFEPRISNPT